ncbi:MAG: hypothetical protein WDO16_03105 [Bacteroidota bacterium]
MRWLLLSHNFRKSGDDQVITSLGGYFFNTGKHRSNEVTVQLVYDYPDRICFLFAQAAGKRIMPVTEFFGRFLYAFPRIFVDSGLSCRARLTVAEDSSSFWAMSYIVMSFLGFMLQSVA